VLVKGLVLAPLYLRTLGATGYGNWLASGNMIALLGALDAGFGVVYMQRLARSHGEADAKGFADETASGAAALAAASIVIIAMSLVITPFVPGWTRALPGTHGQLRWAFALAGIGSGLTVFQGSVDAIFSAWQRPLISGAVRFASRGLEVLILYGMLKLGYGLLSFGASAIGSAAWGTVVGWLMVRRAWRRGGFPSWRISRGALRIYMRQTPPVLAGRTGAVLLNNNEALIISNIASPAIATVYILTDRVYKLGQVVVGILGGAVFAGVAHLAAEDRDGPRFRSVLGEIFTLSAIGAALYCGTGVALNSTFVATLVGPEYFGGQALSALLAAAGVLLIRANLMGTLLQALGWSAVVGWSSLAEVLVRVPLVLVCVRTFGIIGMPIAIIATTVIVNFGAGTYLLARRLDRRVLVAFREMTVRGLPSTSVAVGVGLLLASVAGTHRGWRPFLFEASWATPIVVLVVLLVHPRSRELARAVAHRLAFARKPQ
jgi:O-antigen/teichoic acid export membrane protein